LSPAASFLPFLLRIFLPPLLHRLCCSSCATSAAPCAPPYLLASSIFLPIGGSSCLPWICHSHKPVRRRTEGERRGKEIGISIRYPNKPICSSSSMFCLLIRINLVRRSSSPSSVRFVSQLADQLFFGDFVCRIWPDH
jgi:hypothetical protein